MTQLNHAPIALFLYKRPEHLRLVLESLKRCHLIDRSPVYLFCDAPKTPADRAHVEEARRVAQALAPAHAIFSERQVNQGLSASISKGVTEVCKKHGSVIVLEDDIVVSPHFLSYMNEALSRYSEHSQVMQISGHMFPVDLKLSKEDAVFLPFPTTWGWAVWERAWKHFDPQAKGYEELKNDPALIRKFNLNGSYPYFEMLESALKGEIDSWGIRWRLSHFMKDGLTLYPAHTLVENLGFDGSGTHKDVNPFGTDDLTRISPSFEPKHWPEARINDQAFQLVQDFLRTRGSRGLKKWVKSVLRAFARP